MSEKIEKFSARPGKIEEMFDIPQGTLANLRWAKKGPKYFKVGSRRVLYKVDDVKEWIERFPILTIDSPSPQKL